MERAYGADLPKLRKSIVIREDLRASQVHGRRWVVRQVDGRCGGGRLSYYSVVLVKIC